MIPAIAPVENSLAETFGITDGLIALLGNVVDRLALVAPNDASPLDVDRITDVKINR